MLEFINILGVLQLHLDTLKNFRTKTITLENITAFILLPLLAGIAPMVSGHQIGDTETLAISLFMSIGGAALISILAVLPAIYSGDRPNPTLANLRRRLIVEVRSNIAFCALVALTTIIVLITSLVGPLKYAVVGAVYFFATGYALAATEDFILKHQNDESRSTRIVKFGIVLIAIATGAAILFTDIDTIVSRVTVGLTYFLTATFMVSLIMVIKRLHVLVGKEVEEEAI